ncbi:MAG: HEAT repeat domain-containing protein, partial [Planctomycetes bacterium]|nr:HEAT repeat domain-containing protein [Planctomycetota bacterium]
MNGNNSDRPRRSVRATGPGIAIALTAIVCATALLFRTPLRSRYWAWRITQTDVVAERAVYLTSLCNVGDAGRWGTRVLLAHEVAELRQHGVVVLQHVRTAWSRRKLLQMLRDRDQTVRELAALGLALHGDAAVIPDLCEMFVTGDDTAASAACVALERLGTP